nr:EOG090X02D0 [Ilyocryptus agilis]
MGIALLSTDDSAPRSATLRRILVCPSLFPSATPPGMANIPKVRNRKRNKGEICRMVAPRLVESTTSAECQPLNLCVRDESAESPAVAECVAADRIGSARLPRRRKKRSAIFLPPEKLADNDVCICKFKFIAGNQPRLQEKKILSVDSGGNFRFFPEQQQQRASTSAQQPIQQQQQVVATGKPLPDLLPIDTVLTTGGNPPVRTTDASASSSSTSAVQSTAKKLSRRQKMEQTFGEKGFLIQTQHVPVTEGSAFCKFR